MRKTILILIGGHLSTAPRPLKEAMILSRAGYNITVAGCWFIPKLIARDKEITSRSPFEFVQYADFSPHFPTSRFLIRAKRWSALRFKLFSGSYFGYAAEEMLNLSLYRKANLTIVHSEAGLWVANELALKDYRIGIDFEDWFSEQAGMQEDPNRRQCLKDLESTVLAQASYSLAASRAMSQALRKSYCLKTPPAVAYNTFPFNHSMHVNKYLDRIDSTIPSLLWFSQTIAPGRGLELLMRCLQYIHQPMEIHLRGDDLVGYAKTILEMAPSRHKANIHFHSTVPMDDLQILIREHDIGLALDLPNCQNYDLTVTNKVFQYLSAGLRVIATKTRGQQEVAQYFTDRIFLLVENNSSELASAITTVLDSQQWKSPPGISRLEEFNETIGYQELEKTLVAEADKALS
ncbi:glycosyltransferase [Pseudomonadota bacterium]